jgi:hypothetical protein
LSYADVVSGVPGLRGKVRSGSPFGQHAGMVELPVAVGRHPYMVPLIAFHCSKMAHDPTCNFETTSARTFSAQHRVNVI